MNNEQFYFGNFNLKKKKRIKINNNLKKKMFLTVLPSCTTLY